MKYNLYHFYGIIEDSLVRYVHDIVIKPNSICLQECGEGQYVEKMKWSYQGHTYGLVDFKMKCSGEFFWRSPAIGNPDGDWDHEMNCKESGFRLAAGREDDWPGIVNVRAICLGRSDY